MSEINRFPLHLKLLLLLGWKQPLQCFLLLQKENSSNIFYSFIISHCRSIKLEVWKSAYHPVLRLCIWSLTWATLWQYLQKYFAVSSLAYGLYSIYQEKTTVTWLVHSVLSTTLWLNEMIWVTVNAPSTTCMRTAAAAKSL